MVRGEERRKPISSQARCKMMSVMPFDLKPLRQTASYKPELYNLSKSSGGMAMRCLVFYYCQECRGR